jgi:hypothetical protein
MNENTEQFNMLRTLYWVLEISDDFNALFLVLLWWIGYHVVFWIYLALWIGGAITPSSRYAIAVRLQKELGLAK